MVRTGHAMGAGGGFDCGDGRASRGGGARRGLSRHAGVRQAAVYEMQMREAIEVTIAGGVARYNHVVRLRDKASEIVEKGAGIVKGQNIDLQGSWKDDTRQYEAKYSGTFVRRSAQLKGTQTWTDGGKTVDPRLLGRDQAAAEAIPAAQQTCGVTSRSAGLPRLEAGLLNELPPIVPLHLQVIREMPGRVEHRHDADVDQPLLPERGLVADRDDLVVQLWMMSFGVPAGATKPKYTGARLGKPAPARSARRGTAASAHRSPRRSPSRRRSDMRDEIRQADDRHRHRAGQKSRHHLVAAARRHHDDVGAGLLLPVLEGDLHRDGEHAVGQRAGLGLGQRGELIQRIDAERAVTTSTWVLMKPLVIGSKSFSGL